MSRLWRRENEDGIFILACPHPRCGPDPDEYPMSSPLRPHALLIPPPIPLIPTVTVHTGTLSVNPFSALLHHHPSPDSLFFLFLLGTTLCLCMGAHAPPTYWYLRTLLFISFLSLGKSFSKFPPPLVFTSVVGESEEAA